jgi:hypothetical protein
MEAKIRIDVANSITPPDFGEYLAATELCVMGDQAR